MEAVAAFVFSSGGVARPDELSGFFQRRPEVLEEVLAAGAPSHSLKKIVRKAGAAHGLFWRDDDPQSRERGPVVGHVVTEEQRKRCTFESEVQWVPRALAAIEHHVRALPGRRMKTGAIADFYSAYPLESAFMKRRCRGIVDFVQHYDPEQRRIGWDSTGVFCVQQQPEDGVLGVNDEVKLEKEELSTTPFARLESVVRAEVGSSYALTPRDDLFGEPVLEPQDQDSSSEMKQKARSSWSKCAQEISILPRPNNGEIELRLKTISVRINTSSADDKSILLPSSQNGVNSISKRPVLLCEVSADVLRVLEAVRQVNLVLVHERVPPTPHPLAFLFMAYERSDRARRMRKKTRRAIKATSKDAPSAVALSSQVESVAQEEDPQLLHAEAAVIPNEEQSCELYATTKPSLSLLRDEAWTFEMTRSILGQLNMVLLQIRATPTPHPLAFLFIAYERKRQSRRAERAARRSQALAAKSLLGGMRILIPRATLEILSCCVATAQQPNALPSIVSTSFNFTS